MSTLRWAAPEWHETLGSTNVEALRDPRPGRVVVADHQTAGQGRRGRTWESPPGTGMAITAVVPPVAPEVMGWVPLAAGLCLVEALTASRWRVDAALKWPNDVLVPLCGDEGTAVHEAGDRRWGKVAGVLAQVSQTGPVVVGTGVNVDHDHGRLPVPTATSWRLARGGAPLPDEARQALLTTYLERLATWHDALRDGRADAVRTAYLRRCATLGLAVVVHRPDGGTSAGTAVDVDPSGALLVAVPGGEAPERHHAGDVEHVRAQ